MVRSRHAGPERHRAEGRRGRAVDHELQINSVVRKLQQVELVELRLEFAGKVWRVFRAHAERDDRASISQDGMAHVGRELMQILVGQGKPDPVFASSSR